MTERPNIVYIMPDEWRPDAFGFAGNRVIRTPNIDALAGRGITFGSAYCESPVCQASRASLITGGYPRDHGLQDNEHTPWAGGPFPPPETRTFMHRLQESGYHTAEVGKMHFAAPKGGGGRDLMKLLAEGGGAHLRNRGDHTRGYGFDEAFEETDKIALAFLDSDYTDHLRDKGLLDAWRQEVKESMAMLVGRLPGPPARPENLAPEDTLDAYIGERSCRWIREYNGDRPFFLWVAFVGPHMPYDGPRPYSDRYDASSIPLGPLGLPEIPDNRWGEFFRWNVKHLNCENVTEEDCRLIGKHYYGTCTMIDDYVGKIVETLEQAGLGDNTWIFFGSDHGELLGDHGLVSKRFFYRSSVVVPNVVVPPGGLSSPKQVEGPTQGFDMTATIVDLAGADTEGHHGRSLAPALEGDDVTREAVFSEIAGFLMVATERYKLICDGSTLEPQALWDLQNDPDELQDALSDPAYAEAVDDLLDRHARPFTAGARS